MTVKEKLQNILDYLEYFDTKESAFDFVYEELQRLIKSINEYSSIE